MSTNQAPPSEKFGTFLGVYTPSVLTILGLIMYLRFGWVLGNVGLGLTILIVILASSITFITGLSASAIATNIQVGVGGEYFLVSRSLGLEPGGAIGIPLYLCRTLSVTFYCFGLAEAILIFWPELPPYSIQVLAAVFIIIVTALSGKSATLALKSQIPIMILVGLSLVALIVGVLMHDFRAPEWNATYRSAPQGFWYVFAVFFPAVTGFTAGIGMSGDLKDPRKSIPIGTMGAVITGLAIYLLIPVLFSVSDILSFEELADPTAGVSTWTRVAIFGSILVIPAVWGAILSSAFGSILGGPRVLQALSMDGLAPKFLSKLSKTGQPTVATWISGVIALLAVFLGELNTVAQFVSVLFLTLYIAINLSAAIETLVAEPSYRPRIKIPWYVSLLGALGAIGVMYLISPWACLLALGLELLLLFWLFSRSLEQKWGDVVAGFWMLMTRFSLLKLSQRSIHARNWRPMILLFVKNIDSRMELVKLAEAVGQNHGILTIIKLITTQSDFPPQERDLMEKEMLQKLKQNGLSAFCEAHRVNELEEGILDIAKAHGIASLKTNTIMFAWSDNINNQIKQIRIIHELGRHGKNIMLANLKDGFPAKGGQIDVWWGGRERNGDLMLLLAYLLKLNSEWTKAEITICSVVDNEEEKIKISEQIIKLLSRARINAKLDIGIKTKQSGSFEDKLISRSGQADLVFLGLPPHKIGDEEKLANRIISLCSGLRNTIFIRNNDDMDKVPALLKE